MTTPADAPTRRGSSPARPPRRLAPGGGPSRRGRRRVALLALLLAALLVVCAVGYLTLRPDPAPRRALESAETNRLYEMAPVAAPCPNPDSLTGLVGCARSVHLPALRAYDNQAEPAITGFTGSVETPCGNSTGAAGLYCPINGTIYVETSRPADVQLSVMHEFGHHLQQVAGILPASYAMDLPRGEANRRRELQAVCFSSLGLQQAGLWSDVEAADWRARYAGEPGSTHSASGDTVAHWLDVGASARSYGACNTWTTPPSEVD